METPTNPTKNRLADVAREKATSFEALDWVGMNSIQLPVQVESEGKVFHPFAEVSAFVSLDRQPSRGIHMSRLYSIVQDLLSRESLNPALLRKCVQGFLETHSDLSSRAKIEVKLAWPARRRALVSELSAWRTYPVTLRFESGADGEKYEIEVDIDYSSTCPASAALSRQLIQDQFVRDFEAKDIAFADAHQWLGTSQGIVATPHSQRSRARVRTVLPSTSLWSPLDLIEDLEDALSTPVQTVVKREDEQEFALRNGQNLMFCEDAARRLKAVLEGLSEVQDYRIEVSHFESLHPHNAVSIVRKK